MSGEVFPFIIMQGLFLLLIFLVTCMTICGLELDEPIKRALKAVTRRRVKQGTPYALCACGHGDHEHLTAVAGRYSGNTCRDECRCRLDRETVIDRARARGEHMTRIDIQDKRPPEGETP